MAVISMQQGYSRQRGMIGCFSMLADFLYHFLFIRYLPSVDVTLGVVTLNNASDCRALALLSDYIG